MRHLLLSLFLILTSSVLLAQVENTTLTEEFHSPKKATLLSLAPGGGQIYNKKYWKLPIIYGGLGLSIYYLDRNIGLINLYRGDLKAIQDDDPTTEPKTDFSSGDLNTLLNNYKNLRDWSYISIGVIYALQILDANVDAHLFNFDVDEDLSLNVLPYMDMTTGPATGIYLSLNF